MRVLYFWAKQTLMNLPWVLPRKILHLGQQKILTTYHAYPAVLPVALPRPLRQTFVRGRLVPTQAGPSASPLLFAALSVSNQVMALFLATASLPWLLRLIKLAHLHKQWKTRAYCL